MSSKTNILPVVAVFVAIVMGILMTACNTHADWQREAEHTNQLQIHEHALTQREVINAATVSDAVDNMLNNH